MSVFVGESVRTIGSARPVTLITCSESARLCGCPLRSSWLWLSKSYAVQAECLEHSSVMHDIAIPFLIEGERPLSVGGG